MKSAMLERIKFRRESFIDRISKARGHLALNKLRLQWRGKFGNALFHICAGADFTLDGHELQVVANGGAQ